MTIRDPTHRHMGCTSAKSQLGYDIDLAEKPLFGREVTDEKLEQGVIARDEDGGDVREHGGAIRWSYMYMYARGHTSNGGRGRSSGEGRGGLDGGNGACEAWRGWSGCERRVRVRAEVEWEKGGDVLL